MPRITFDEVVAPTVSEVMENDLQLAKRDALVPLPTSPASGRGEGMGLPRKRGRRKTSGVSPSPLVGRVGEGKWALAVTSCGGFPLPTSPASGGGERIGVPGKRGRGKNRPPPQAGEEEDI